MVPICNQFAWVSLKIFEIFLDAMAKAEKTNSKIYSTEYHARFPYKEVF